MPQDYLLRVWLEELTSLLRTHSQTVTSGLSDALMRICGILEHEGHKRVPISETLVLAVLHNIVEETESELSLRRVALVLNQATDMLEQLSLKGLHKVVWVIFNQCANNLSQLEAWVREASD